MEENLLGIRDRELKREPKKESTNRFQQDEKNGLKTKNVQSWKIRMPSLYSITKSTRLDINSFVHDNAKIP